MSWTGNTINPFQSVIPGTVACELFNLRLFVGSLPSEYIGPSPTSVVRVSDLGKNVPLRTRSRLSTKHPKDVNSGTTTSSGVSGATGAIGAGAGGASPRAYTYSEKVRAKTVKGNNDVGIRGHKIQPSNRLGGGGGGGGYSFVTCSSRLTVDHASIRDEAMEGKVGEGAERRNIVAASR